MIKPSEEMVTLTPVLRWTLIIFSCFLLGWSFIYFWPIPETIERGTIGQQPYDRPIFSYWVNDKWGGNAAAKSVWGSCPCLLSIEGKDIKGGVGS